MVAHNRLLIVLVLAGTGSCGDGATAPAFSVRPGEFTLVVTSFDGGTGHLTIADDGGFTASPTVSWAECTGTLTASEFDRIADAVSRADALVATDTYTGMCDGPRYEIALSVVAGPSMGEQNTFGTDVCSLDAALWELTRELVPEVVDRVVAEGSCTAGLYCDPCAGDEDCASIPDAVCVESFCCDRQQMKCTPDLCRTSGWP